MKKPLNHRAKAAQDRLDFDKFAKQEKKKKKKPTISNVVFFIYFFFYLSDAFTNKPLKDGRTAQDMLLKYDYVETLLTDSNSRQSEH